MARPSSSQGNKRTLQSDALDMSRGHGFVAPFEILHNSVGPLRFLTSGHLFEQSYASLYLQSLKSNWDNVFITRRNALEKPKKPNENSVMKCLLLNGLLHLYQQDPEDFKIKTANLHKEIMARMSSNYASTFGTREQLFDEVKRWRSVQGKRHLFHYDYRPSETTPLLPSFLMMYNAMNRYCQNLVEKYRRNPNDWKTQGPPDFQRLFDHAFIIVAQPLGVHDVPATHYTKYTSGQQLARLNARIICLINPQVFGENIELSNIDVTLCSMNLDSSAHRLRQPPIAWKTELVRSMEGEVMPIHYAEVDSLQIKFPFAKRVSSTTGGTNLCTLEFQPTVHVEFDHSKLIKRSFSIPLTLTSEPFGVSSHIQYAADTVAKVFLNKLRGICQTGPLTVQHMVDHIGYYFQRMVGVTMRRHTREYIHDIFQSVWEAEDAHVPTSTNSKSLIEDRLTRVIAQIKCLVDYPVLAMMYDDGLFLGICDGEAFDRQLRGTINAPHILLRFQQLLSQNWNETAEIRCIIHNGTERRTSFSRTAFVADMCRFIYELVSAAARQTKLLTSKSVYSENDLKRYDDPALRIISGIAPPNSCEYKPLIPVLWQLKRDTEERPRDDDAQSDMDTTSTDTRQSSNFWLNNGSVTITCATDPNNFQSRTMSHTFEIRIPGDVDLKRDDVIHHLSEKLNDLFNNFRRGLDDYVLESRQNSTAAPVNRTRDPWLSSWSEDICEVFN